MNTKYLLFWILFFICFLPAYSQNDTAKKQTIDIISTFKPEIRNAPKLNFSATYLISDSIKYLSPYNIPSLNLLFGYQPIPLKPLALDIDSALQLGVRNYLKVGYGNLSSPFAITNLNFGNGVNRLFNLSANYFSSKGSILNQDYSQFKSKFSGTYFTPSNELFGNVGLNIQNNYLYGYDHSILNFKKEDVLQKFTDIQGSFGVRNKLVNDLGINYFPFVQFSFFDNYLKLKENSFKFDLPLEKSLGDFFSFKFSAKADINSYTSNNSLLNIHFNNTLFHLSPELIYRSNLFKIHGGLKPSWDDGQFVLLPNFHGQVNLSDLPLILQVGYTGQLVSNSFRNLSSFNPYLGPLLKQQNTREKELYFGLQSSPGNHINFSTKFSYIQYNNLPLFVNDTIDDNKSFLVNSVSEINNFRFHAAVSYISSDQFSLTTGITYNGYSTLKDNQKPWGTLPFELINSIRWRATNKLQFKSDSKFFTGGPFVLKNNVEKTLLNGADLSVGAEYLINKRFSAWIDVNNIFNNKYERWHNYQVYGINLLGGFIIKF